MNRNSRRRPLGRSLAPLLLFALGCGGGAGEYNTAVEGVVTLDGQPLGNVLVSFVPKGQGQVQPPVSTARTDEQGRFKLRCKRNGSADEPGAVLGTHSVLVTEQAADRKKRGEDPDSKAAAVPGRKVPAHYGVPGQTPLTVEVTADKHDYALSLTSR
jgi:hypothetical protein